MKRIILAAAALAAVSGTASAMTSSLFEAQLSTVAPSVDASALSDAQVRDIENVLFSVDSTRELRGRIMSIVKNG